MTTAVRAVIMAFDDVLVHTRDVRADAIVQAAAAHHIVLERERVAREVTGQSLAEIVRTLLAGEPTALHDPTLVELITLVAARTTARMLPHGGAGGVRIDATARARCADCAAQGTRVILRVDSTRRDVEALMHLTALDELPLVAICADDRLDGVGTERIALRAWRTIDRRLTALGIPPSARLAIEGTQSIAEIANAYADAWEVLSPSR